MIDHVVYAVADLAIGVNLVAEQLGVVAQEGGVHIGRGTHNALLGLGGGAYLEIIAPDPNQPDPAQPRPFGIDDIVAGREPEGVVAWCARSAYDLETTRRRLVDHGVAYGPVEAMSRATPDGAELRWRLCVPSVAELRSGVPFFIDWGETPHPSEVLAAGAELVQFVVPANLHADAIAAEVGDDPRLKIDVSDASGFSVAIETEIGVVHL